MTDIFNEILGYVIANSSDILGDDEGCFLGSISIEHIIEMMMENSMTIGMLSTHPNTELLVALIRGKFILTKYKEATTDEKENVMSEYESLFGEPLNSHYFDHALDTVDDPSISAGNA